MIVVTGISHRTAPLAVRESVAFSPDERTRALARLRAEPGVEECVVLSTCNRVEIYAECAPGAAGTPAAFLAARGGLEAQHPSEHLYRLEGEAAIRHAFAVAASLDSMVVGETQILGQVKEAYEAAEEAGTLGPVLGNLRNRTLAAAKRVRSETEIGQHAVSVSHVAVELARKIFGGLGGRQVLLVGAGKMSELAARLLVQDGAAATVLGGRSIERAEALALELGGRAVPFHCLAEELERADVVISSTAAPGVVIARSQVEAARSRRGSRPLFLVDIAMPRDVDPSVRGLEGVFLYDLDDLKAVCGANLQSRERQVAPAAAIVEQELRDFIAAQRSRQAVPLLVALRRRADDVRRQELDRVRGRLGALSADQERALEGIASAIVNKLLHAPTVYLKQAAQQDDGGDLHAVCRVLGLSPVLDLGASGS